MIRLNSDIPQLDDLISRIEYFLSQDVLEVEIDGTPIRGYRSPDTKSIWIRDYSDMLRGARYYEHDVKSVVQHFADTQAMNGRIFDYFTTHPEKLPCERENWTKYVRVPVEADVEYRFVKAAWLAYQASGDRDWFRKILPHLEKAIHYMMNDPQRWDDKHNLVKRPYTIDTWDFAYTAGKHPWLQFQIDEHTFWGIFHGDNSGLYESLLILAKASELVGNLEKQAHYKTKAEQIKKRTNAYCWNGNYYSHFKKITPVLIENCEEEIQLSLSNPISLNRGLGNLEMAKALLEEYRTRGAVGSFFAPWFSIEPPFPNGSFGDSKLIAGAYINGGIFPLAGGELALLALQSGEESYGIQQILNYESLTQNGETYLWYFPDGSPSTVETSTSPDATPTDGWGSSAFLTAIVQGLAGIIDLDHSFQNINFSPRWIAADCKKADFEISYAASGKNLQYKYRLQDSKMKYKLTGDFERIEAHILLPERCSVKRVLVNGESNIYDQSDINNSSYIDFQLLNHKSVEIDIIFDPKSS